VTRALVVLVALLFTGCVSQSAALRGKAAAAPTQPTPAIAPAPSPGLTAPVAPGPSASQPGPAAPVPGPALEILYVKTNLANFREGAGTSMKILRVLRQGTRLQVLESRNTWLRVRLDDGKEGWVAESVTSTKAPVTPVRAPAKDRPPSEITGA